MAKFYYGGQAVIEGVMMRGRRSAAVAVRQPTGGILLHEEMLPKRVYGAKVGRGRSCAACCCSGICSSSARA